MKICIVSLPATALFFVKARKEFSGAEVQLKLLAEQLAKKKEFEVSFIVEGAEGLGRKFDQIEVARFDSRANRWSKIPFLRTVPILLRFYRLLSKLSPDVIIQRSAGFMTFSIYFYCRLTGKKFVYMISHDWDVDGTKKKKLGLAGLLFDMAMKRSDMTIAQNRNQKDRYRNYAKKVIPVIHNGFPVYGVRKKRNYILAVTRLVAWKNPDLLLALADRFPKEKFVFVGGRREDRELASRFFRASRMRSNVVHLDSVSFSENELLYAKAKLLVLTSNAEGMPNVLLQAAAAGVPTVSYKLDPEGLLSNGLGLVSNGDREKMVEQIAYLLRNPEKAREMGDRGRQIIKERFSIEKSGGKLGDLLLNL